MGPGDYVNIPAHRRHRVEWTTPDEPTTRVAVHYGQCASASPMFLLDTATDREYQAE